MNTQLIIAIVLIVLFIGAVFSSTVRLLRRSRKLESKLDYSKLRKWEDDEDEDDR